MPGVSEANQPVPDGASPVTAAPPVGVLVRPAQIEDAPRLGLINVDTWRDTYQAVIATTYLDALDIDTMSERWRGLLAEPHDESLLVVSELNGVVAGYARGGPYRTQQDAPAGEDTTGWGELYAIYTHPSLQGRGAGTAVQEALLAALAAHGYSRAGLWTPRANVATIGWYGRRGWRSDGATTVWMGTGEPVPEVRLVHDLPASLRSG